MAKLALTVNRVTDDLKSKPELLLAARKATAAAFEGAPRCDCVLACIQLHCGDDSGVSKQTDALALGPVVGLGTELQLPVLADKVCRDRSLSLLTRCMVASAELRCCGAR